MKKRLFALTLTMLSVAGNAVAQAATQPGDGEKQQKIAAIKESLAKNQAALKQYSWTETTQISIKGEVKKTTQKECHYGPDGKVVKTELPGAAPQQPQQQGRGGRRRDGLIKKEIIENKIEDLKEYMERVGTLIHDYVPPNPQSIQAQVALGRVDLQPGAGVSTLTVKDYFKQGDSLAFGFDSASKKIRRLNVYSYVEKPKDDDVKMAVTFASLPDGTNHPEQTLLDVIAKKIQVKVTNSGYKKSGQ